MLVNRFRAWVLVSIATLAGCSRELGLPEQAPVGGLAGVVDTAPHIAPGNLPVAIVDSSGYRLTVTTEVDGAFRAGNLRPGTYAIDLRAPGFAPLVVPFVKVLPGAETDAGVLAPGWLGGTTQAGSIKGVVSAPETVDITGAQVSFFLMPNKDLVATQALGQSGVFVQSPVPPGAYRLVASHPEFQDSDPMDLTVAEGEKKDLSTTPLLLKLNKGHITGTILKEVDHNAPVPATQYAVVIEGSATSAITDGQGQFIADVNPGTYRVFYAPSLDGGTGSPYLDPDSNRTVTVHGGKTVSLPPTTLLLARGVITGSVELSDRTPIDQLTVVTLSGYSGQVTPNAAEPWRGDFIITGVPYGSVEVSAAKQRYSRDSQVVTVGPTPVSAGTLKLALQQGDFVIDDTDATSEPGYTRSLAVTLNFTGFPKTGVTGYRASEAADFADGGFLGYSGTTQPFTLANADGQHTVYAQYQDSNNNVSPTFQQTIVVDRVAPSAPAVTFLHTGEVGQGATLKKFTNLTQSLPLTVTGTDNAGGSGLSRMRLASSLLADGGIDDATARDGYATSTSLKNQNGAAPFADGPVAVFAQLIDQAGNLGPIGTDAIVVDHTPPQNGSVSIADGPKATLPGWTNSIQVQVTPAISAEPFGGILQVKYANAAGPELDGAPYVSVRDNTPWSLATAAVCDGGVCPGGTDGPRRVYAVFRDSAGNTSTAVFADITLDTTPPTPGQISATLASPSPTNSNLVKVAVSAAAAAGVVTSAGLTVSEDYGFTSPGTLGPVAMPGTGTVDFTVSPGEGPRPFFVRFRDGAGNDAVVPLSVMIDTTPPAGTISLLGALADGTLSTSISASSTVNVQANVTGATGYFLGDGTLAACPTTPASYTAIPASGLIATSPAPTGGTLAVRACFRDDAGNVFGGPVIASVSPLLWAPAATIGYKGTPPTGCTLAVTGLMADGITSAPLGLTAKPTVSFSIASCTGATEMVMSNGPLNCNSLPASTSWQPFNTSGTFNVPAGDGPKTISVCVRDIARNPAALTPSTITLDTTPPAPSTVSATVTTPSPSNALVVQLAVTSTATDLSITQALTVSEDYGFTAAGTAGPMAMPGSGTLAFTLAAGDGARTFYARFLDRVGNATIVPLSVAIDTQPPSGTISLLGALFDGTPSSTLSATTTVSVQAAITGAVSYFLGDGTLTGCPTAASSYTALPSSGLISATLTAQGGALTTRACFRDAAGNVLGGPVAAAVSPLLWVPAATIAFDATAPVGCTLSVSGTNVDGSPALAGKTAVPSAAFSIGGCAGATELVIASGALTCAALPSTANWQPFVTAGTVPLPLGDGVKTVSACARDGARNLSTLTPATLTLDQTPPALSTVSATLSSPSPTNSLSLTVAVSSTATDLSATQAVTVSEDYSFKATGTVGPMAMPPGGTVPFTISAGDGVRTFYVRFRDAVGNDTIVPVNVTIDSTPPAGSISLQGALFDGTPSTTVSAVTAVSVLTSITGAVSYYLGDQTLAACPSSASSYTALPSSGVIAATLTPAAGSLTTRACFRDAAGNVVGGPVAAAVSPLLWVPAAQLAYDATPPSGCTLGLAGTTVQGGAAPAGKTANTSVTFTISSCTGATEMAIATGALTCASLPPSVNWQPFVTAGALSVSNGDGAKTVSVCVRDAARNLASPVPANITLDQTPPAISSVSASVTGPQPTNALALTVAVASTATDLSPTQALTVSEDYAFVASGTVGPMGLPGGGTVPFTISAGEGVRTFYARFRDTVGNDTIVPVNVTIDTTPPTGTVSLQGFLADGTPSSTVSQQTGVNVLPSVTGAVSYYLGDQTLAACPGSAASYTAIPASGVLPQTITASGGTLTTRACFRDAAGNVFGGPVAAAVSSLLWVPAAQLAYDNVAPTGCTLAVTGTMADTGLAAPAGFSGRGDVTYALSGCAGGPVDMVVANGALSCASLPPTVAWQSFVSAGQLTLPLGDGSKTVSACVRDAARNVATLTPVNITLDTAAPLSGQVTLGLSSPNPTNSTVLSVTVSSSATDLSATPLSLSEDYAFVAPGTVGPIAMPGGPQSFTLTPGEGTRTFYVRLKDQVGNALITPMTVVIDTTPPAGTVTLEGTLGDGSPSTVWSSQTSVTVHAEGVTGNPVSYYVGSSTMTSCPAPGAYIPMPSNKLLSATLTSTTVGGKIVLVARVCFRDAAGNVFGATDPSSTLGWSPAASIQYNASAPTGCTAVLTGKKVDGTSAPGGLTARTDVAFDTHTCVGATEMVVSSSGSPCASAQPTDWVPYSPYGTVNLPIGDGLHSVQFCVRNPAFNVFSFPVSTITLDTTPPVNAYVVVENGDGWVNQADKAARGGVKTRIDATYSGASQLIVEYNPTLGLTNQAIALGASPSTLFVGLSPSVDPGQQQFNTYFVDAVGNATPRISNTVGVDTAAPATPVLSSVDPRNRSATLFWLPLASDPTVAGYGLLSAATPAALPPPPSATTVQGNVGQGAVTGLLNRTEYQFAIYAYDAAGNTSGTSNAIIAVTGFVQKKVPIVSGYPLQPLDVLLDGDDVYLTYSEQTAGWGTISGNVKLAHSADRGATWTFTTLDAEFGFNRSIARLSQDPSSRYVTTVGTNLFLSDAGVSNPDIGALKIYSSSKSTPDTWSTLSDNTTTPTDFTDVSGTGLISVGTQAQAYYLRSPGNLNQIWPRSFLFSYFFMLPCGYFPWGPCPPPPLPYYDIADGQLVKDLKSCTGNSAELHAWRAGSASTTTINVVSQRFPGYSNLALDPNGDGDFKTSADGGVAVIPAGAVRSLDLACSALPGRTDGYLLYQQNNSLGLRRRLGIYTNAGQAWTTGATLPVDADATAEPHVYASGTSVHIVYRSTAAEMKLGSSTDEGATFAWTRLTTDPAQGLFPVISGDGHADLAIASVSADQSVISVLLPAMRNVHAVASPGVTTASLDWDAVSTNQYRLDRNTTGVAPFPDTVFTAQAHFTVPLTPGQALYHQISATDSEGQGTDEGQIWQVAPFKQATLYTPTGGCPVTDSAAIVAHDAKVLAMGPLGCKAAGDSDLSMYRSSDNGNTWATYNTGVDAGVTARALDGANGRAVLAFKKSGVAGLQVRTMSDIAGLANAEVTVDATATAEYVAVGADRTPTSTYFTILAANQAADTISVVWCSGLSGSCFVESRLTVPNAATSTILGVAVVKYEGPRLTIAWRQNNSAATPTQQIYYAESANYGASFATPQLVSDGNSLPPGNQAMFMTNNHVSGAGNGAHTFIAHPGGLVPQGQTLPYTLGLWVHVTGNDTPNSGSNFFTFSIDDEPELLDVVDGKASPSGNYILYETNGLLVPENHLKMAYCRTDCHLKANWYHNTIKTLVNGGYGPALGISTVSAGSEERMYGLFYDQGAMNVLTGGAMRRTR